MINKDPRGQARPVARTAVSVRPLELPPQLVVHAHTAVHVFHMGPDYDVTKPAWPACQDHSHPYMSKMG